jgi:hypothetical protein
MLVPNNYGKCCDDFFQNMSFVGTLKQFKTCRRQIEKSIICVPGDQTSLKGLIDVKLSVLDSA